MRIFIKNGLYHGGYEPHLMPGAFIFLQHDVVDSTGTVKSQDIFWDGPGTWIESRDGVPDGYNALWLGERDATNPYVVFVKTEPTEESTAYEKAYRKGWYSKRNPKAPSHFTENEVDGLFRGWFHSPNNRSAMP